MKKHTRGYLALTTVFGLLLGLQEARGQTAAVAGTPKKTYDVAAFVWPSYHPDDRAKGFWPMGIGEWETVMKNNTPVAFEKTFREAETFVDAQSGCPPLITVNSWNEWPKTSYLLPCDLYGCGYLEVVRKIFREVTAQRR